MESWEDDRKAQLRQMFPGWDIWYVRHSIVRRHTWCARPKGAPVAIFHAEDSAQLASKIARAVAEESAGQ